ncbi:MAG: hypothetical protein PHH16_00335 [Candidatus Gracilibacteria bacterium]|nr:hypothetical protein [Candidatus Gracilibacteria bacterium]
MLRKIVLSSLFILFILTSCSREETKKATKDIPKTAIGAYKDTAKINKNEVLQEKRRSALLEGTREEERAVLSEFDTVRKSGNAVKREELFIHARKLKETRQNELSEALKNGDEEKINEIKKIIRLLDEVSR